MVGTCIKQQLPRHAKQCLNQDIVNLTEHSHTSDTFINQVMEIADNTNTVLLPYCKITLMSIYPICYINDISLKMSTFFIFVVYVLYKIAEICLNILHENTYILRSH